MLSMAAPSLLEGVERPAARCEARVGAFGAIASTSGVSSMVATRRGRKEERLGPPERPVFARAKGALVLIVDDDVILRALAAGLLEQMGCESEGVATGAEASAAVARAAGAGRAFDLVLLDQHLWQETGQEVCQRLRDEGFEGSIVAISGDGFTLDRQLREAGFDADLKKPFSAQELYACVEGQVGRRHSRFIETG
jgi:CheY-like chemotaxis protein